MGLYVYIWDVLLKANVPAKFCDGLLDSTLHYVLVGVPSSSPIYHLESEARHPKWKEVRSKNYNFHLRLTSEVKMLRAVLVEGKQQAPYALARAFEVGQVFESMLANGHAQKFVKDTSAARVWEGRSFKLLASATEVRNLLLKHDAICKVQEFDRFVATDRPGQLSFIAVENTMIESIQAAMRECFKAPDVFYAQLSYTAALVCMPTTDFHCYQRFASVLLTGGGEPGWTPYAVAPVICQLLTSDSTLPQAIELLRRLCKLPNPGAAISKDLRVLQTVHALLKRWAADDMPSMVELALPLLLSLEPFELLAPMDAEAKRKLADKYDLKMPSLVEMSTWEFMTAGATALNSEPAKRFEFVMQCKAPGYEVNEAPVVKEGKGVNLPLRHPYSSRMKKTQWDRALPAEDKCPASCNLAHIEAVWQTLAIFEQRHREYSPILSPVRPLASDSAFGDQQGHFCLKSFDLPIARHDRPEGISEVYHHSVFPVFALSVPLDVPDRFRGIRTAYKHLVQPSMYQNVANLAKTGGIMWKPRIEDIAATLEDLAPFVNDPQVVETSRKRKSPSPPLPEPEPDKKKHKKKNEISGKIKQTTTFSLDLSELYQHGYGSMSQFH